MQRRDFMGFMNSEAGVLVQLLYYKYGTEVPTPYGLFENRTVFNRY